jgi:hypothetical protein
MHRWRKAAQDRRMRLLKLLIICPDLLSKRWGLELRFDGFERKQLSIEHKCFAGLLPTMIPSGL